MNHRVQEEQLHGHYMITILKEHMQACQLGNDISYGLCMIEKWIIVMSI